MKFRNKTAGFRFSSCMAVFLGDAIDLGYIYSYCNTTTNLTNLYCDTWGDAGRAVAVAFQVVQNGVFYLGAWSWTIDTVDANDYVIIWPGWHNTLKIFRSNWQSECYSLDNLQLRSSDILIYIYWDGRLNNHGSLPAVTKILLYTTVPSSGTHPANEYWGFSWGEAGVNVSGTDRSLLSSVQVKHTWSYTFIPHGSSGHIP
jgi:hypothetical protein